MDVYVPLGKQSVYFFFRSLNHPFDVGEGAVEEAIAGATAALGLGGRRGGGPRGREDEGVVFKGLGGRGRGEDMVGVVCK